MILFKAKGKKKKKIQLSLSLSVFWIVYFVLFVKQNSKFVDWTEK